MKQIISLLMLLFSIGIYGQCCEMTIDMVDANGDGWDNSRIEVSVDNSLIGTYTNFGATNSITIPVCDGQVVSLDYIDGTFWDAEISFRIYNSEGKIEEVLYPNTDLNFTYVGNFCSKDTIVDPPTTCAEAAPICASDLSFRATGDPTVMEAQNSDPGNDYDCLNTAPNPSWYYFQVDDPGDIYLELSAQYDVDFIIWGPFPDVATAKANCNSYTNVVDCSYATSNVENPTVIGAQTGEVYMLLITNYANQEQDIYLEQIAGSATTDCNVVFGCNSVITGVPSSCNPFNNYYDFSGEIFIQGGPDAGTLLVYSANDGDTLSFDAPFAESYTFTLDSLNSDNAQNYLITQYQDSTGCRDTLFFTAPAYCQCTAADIGNSGVGGSITLCRNNTNYDLFNYLDGSQLMTGNWFDQNFIGVSNVYNPGVQGPGTFYYVTGANGCEDTSFVIVNLLSPILDPVSDYEICIDDSVTINLSMSDTINGYTAYFSDGTTGQNPFYFTPVDSTSYSVYIQDGNGCESDTMYFDIHVWDSIQLTLSISDNFICTDSLVYLQASATGGYSGSNLSSNFQFTWGDDQGLITGNNFANVNVALTAANRLWVTVDENHICNSPSVSDTVFVDVHPLATLALDQTSYVACANGNVDFTTAVYPVSEQGTINWNFGDGNTFSSTALTASNVYANAGTYTVTVTNVSNDNCPSDSVFVDLVTIYQPIIAADELHQICIDDVFNLETSVTGHYGNYTEYWNQGLVGNGPHSVSPNTLTQYEVYIIDDLGCQSTTQRIQLDYYDSIVINSITLSDTIVCQGFPFSATINISGGQVGAEGGAYDVSWYDATGLLDNGTYFGMPIDNTTNFWVVVNESSTCNTPSVSDSFMIEVYSIPTFYFDFSTDTLCEGETVELYVTTDPINALGSITWTLNGFEKLYGDTVSYTLPFAGAIDVEIENVLDGGCFYDTLVEGLIVVNPNPTADFYHEPYQTTILDPNFELINTSSDYTNSLWIVDPLTGTLDSTYSDDHLYTFDSEEGGYYPVTLWVENEFFCSDTVTKLLKVKDTYFVYVPSGFTPNGDGLNDVFDLKVLNIELEGFVLSIYDRWGKVVYQTTDPTAYWDGTLNGRTLSNDVYYFHVEFVESRFGELIEHEERGHVNILK